jgi:ABC-type multidrug transport system fused ATPase/permease subunit
MRPMPQTDPPCFTTAGNSPLRRLLQQGWAFRREAALLLFLNGLLLAMSLWTLELAGAGIDIVRNASAHTSPAVTGPLGFALPATWSPHQQLACVVTLLVVFSVATAVLKYATSAAGTRASQSLLTRLRAEVYDKLQRMSFPYFDKTDSSSLINRASSDVLAVKSFVDGVLLKLLSVALSLAVYLAYMLQVHAGLTLACLATTPLLCLGTVWFSKTVQPEYRQSSLLVDQLIQTLVESFHGIQVIKGFHAEETRLARFEQISGDIQRQKGRVFWLTSVFQPVMGILPQINQFVLLVFGGALVIRGELPLGTGLFVFANLLQEFSNQVGQLTSIANTAQTCLAGAERVFEILDAPAECNDPQRHRSLPHVRGAIRFEDVCFGYGSVPVLHDLSFEIKAGECVGIAGLTGSGKSTILNLVPRFYEASHGSVQVDGVDVRDLDIEQLRSSIGFVFQDCFLFSNTIAANIAFGRPGASRDEIRQAAKFAAADRFIESLPDGYETIIGENGANLSGGQRQRIALARTLLLQPPILLVDDTTSAVDPETEREMQMALSGLLHGRTSIVVSNRLSTLIHVDRIFHVKEGHIVEQGSPSELLRDGSQFLELVGAQIDESQSSPTLVHPQQRPPLSRFSNQESLQG